MKRNEKMLRKVFEADKNTTLKRTIESMVTIKDDDVTLPSLNSKYSKVVETTCEASIYSATPPTIQNTILSEINPTSDAPLLPPTTSIDRNTFLSEVTTTPDAPIYSAITPIDPNTFLSEVTTTPEAPIYSPITPIDRNTFLSEVTATPEAPIYSPITPIDRNTFLSEVTATPEAPIYSPITPIDRNTFLSDATIIDVPLYSPTTSGNRNIFLTRNKTIIPESSENSSPVRAMSPETLKFFRTLDYSDDDSVQDPIYVANEDLHSSSSDESSSHTKIVTALVHTKKRNASNDVREGEDVCVFPEPERVPASNSHSYLQSISKPLKRRRSENDLQQLNERQSKKVRRSASISGAIFSEQIPTTKSPKKKHVSDPTKWKRRIERDKRLRGEAYKTIKGKLVPAVPIKQPKCLEKLKHKCNANVPEEARKQIYDSFRALGTLEAQRQFLIQHVTKEKKKRSTTNGPSRKESTHHYYFTIGHEKVTVCRDFFLDTLNIKEGLVRGALKKVSSEGVLIPDKRGKKPPSNKLSTYRYNLIKKHIFSFPAVESHYCRKNTEYRYLDSELNINIMYKKYKEKCEEDGSMAAGIETYRKVFRSYKLRFHVPKKDLCKKCVAHKFAQSKETINTDDEYLKHLKRRGDAFLRRDADKEAAKTDTNTLAFNFDLEAVLPTPKGASGPFFYVRKLAVYNLTFYKFGDQDVDCFTWDETEGKRGSTEIATCVYKYISGKEGITHVRMMSDNCGGQQKNFNFSCMLLYLVTNNPTIQTIDHVFFEPGHSHMECDSIHSKIEQKCKHSAVYTPDGWIQVMRLARTNPRPFNVNVLTHDEFLNFNSNDNQFVEETKKKETQKRSKNKTKKNNIQINIEQQDENKEEKKTNYQDAVWIQYRKNSPKSIFIKTDYNDETFKELKIKPKRGKTGSIEPVPVYTARMPISKAKKRDLLKLCRDNQIPKYYHTFYENLPDSETIRDCLPEPDAEDEED